MFYNHPYLLIADLLLVMIMTSFIFVAWYFNRRFKGIWEWFIAFACGSANVLIFILKPISSELISDLILNTLLISTGYFAFLGSRRYMGIAKEPYKAQLFLIAAIILASAYFREGNSGISFVLSSLAAGGFCIAAGLALWKGAFTIHPMRHALSIGILIHGAFMALRPLLFTAPAEAFIDTYLSMNGFVLILFEQIIFSPTLGLSVILLINEENARQLRIQAEYDSLTCLRNRGSFFARLRKAISLSTRLRTPLSILSIDLDRFKSINDKYGHQAGDDVLRSFSRIAEQCIRDGDELGRIGGEEFCIFLMNTPTTQAVIIAERLRSMIEKSPIEIDGQTISYTASIGIASFNESSSLESVIDKADRALYLAKRNGRNRIEIENSGAAA
jgi:diguanylate cyclase (GGDEF)-like protein